MRKLTQIVLKWCARAGSNGYPFKLVDELLQAKRSHTLTAALAKLQRYDDAICDQLGYTPRGRSGRGAWKRRPSERPKSKFSRPGQGPS